MGIVVCRNCKEKIDTDKDKGIWVSPINRRYYHTSCWDRMDYYLNHTEAVVQPSTEIMDYKELSYLYLKRKVRMAINDPMFNTQWDNLLKKKFQPKGIYLTLKYYYDYLKGNPDKANGGIGIVESIYAEAKKYFDYKYSGSIDEANKIIDQYRKLQEEVLNCKAVKRKPRKKRPHYELLGEDDLID